MNRRAHIEILKDPEGGWRWHVHAANGRHLTESRAFSRPRYARNDATRTHPTTPIGTRQGTGRIQNGRLTGDTGTWQPDPTTT